MSLNFDLTAVKERLGEERYEFLTTSPETRGKENAKWHPVTDRLIWWTMALGLNRIEESNLAEWYFRTAFLQKIDGPEFQYNDGRKVYLTKQDIKNHIGLRTNVTTETRAAWLKRVIDSTKIDLASGEPEPGIAISAQEHIDVIYSQNQG